MLIKKIKTTNMELTDAISAYVHKKVDALYKFVMPDEEALAEIEIGRTTNHHHKGEVYKAEINLIYGKDNFRTVIINDDLYAAIDKMKEGILNEVRRSKRKRFHLFKKGHQRIKDILRGWKRSK